jgi:hypothetical protein
VKRLLPLALVVGSLVGAGAAATAAVSGPDQATVCFGLPTVAVKVLPKSIKPPRPCLIDPGGLGEQVTATVCVRSPQITPPALPHQHPRPVRPLKLACILPPPEA